MNRARVLAATAALALSLAPAGLAAANPDNHGNALNAPGQSNANDNCSNTVDRQEAKGVEAGGGPKAGIPAPTNCDHYFQNIGAIGGGNGGAPTP